MKLFLSVFIISILCTGGLICQDNTSIIGDWMHHKSIDPFDTTEFAVSMEAGSSLRTTGLLLVCASGPPEIVVMYNFGKYLVGSSRLTVPIRYSIDGGAPSDYENWRLIPGHRSASPLKNSAAFVTKLYGASTIHMEVTDPHDGERLKHEFSLGGLDRVLAKLSCGQQNH